MLEKYLSKVEHNHQIVLILAITFITGLVVFKYEKKKPKLAMAYDIQTQIPAGYNLYALDIDNFESINAIVDNYALINIYQVHQNKLAQLILQKVKLIRSPKDARHFAVLATNSELEVLTSHSGPFKVALQNPNKPNQKIVSKKIYKPRQIIVEDQL